MWARMCIGAGITKAPVVKYGLQFAHDFLRVSNWEVLELLVFVVFEQELMFTEKIEARSLCDSSRG